MNTNDCLHVSTTKAFTLDMSSILNGIFLTTLNYFELIFWVDQNSCQQQSRICIAASSSSTHLHAPPLHFFKKTAPFLDIYNRRSTTPDPSDDNFFVCNAIGDHFVKLPPPMWSRRLRTRWRGSATSSTGPVRCYSKWSFSFATMVTSSPRHSTQIWPYGRSSRLALFTHSCHLDWPMYLLV
jgi:hypothetical protein